MPNFMTPPKDRLLFSVSVFAMHPKSSLDRETAIPRRGSSLAWDARMVSFTLPLSRGLPPALRSIWTP